MMCVGNDDDVRAVATGAGRRARRHGRAARSSSTTRRRRPTSRARSTPRRRRRASASSTRRCPAARPAPRTASSRSWSAATPTTFARAEARARALRARGDADGRSGRGQLTKMVNQICIAGLVQALSEGIDFAQRAGLDAERVLDVISKGAAQSWQMENRGKTMVADKFDFGFAVDWMRKDLGDLPRRGAQQRRGAAGHRDRRPVLRPRAGARRRTLGHVEPDPPAARRVTRRATPERPRVALRRHGGVASARPERSAHRRAGPRRCRRVGIDEHDRRLIAAVFASMIVAEQYFSFDSVTARSTCVRGRARGRRR